MYRMLMLVVATLLVSIIATEVCAGDEGKKDTGKVAKLGAADLMKKLAEGGKKAEAKYKGKMLVIEGTVSDVDTKTKMVTLKGGKFTDVVCEFPTSRNDQLIKIKVGAKVSIQGTFRETVATGNAWVEKCELVK